MRNIVVVLIATVFLVGCSRTDDSAPAPAPASIGNEPADMIIGNARIYTVNESQPWATAVAIRDGNFVFVGDDEGAAEFAGPETTLVDLNGNLVLPGLVSGHEHPLVMAGFAAALQIEYSEDKEKMLEAVRRYVTEQPDAAKMSWGGSYEGRVDIYREDIDAVVEEPFVMIAASGHGAWMNSSALEAIGVAKGAEVPVDGYEVDEDGNPNGYASTSAAAMYAVIQLGLIKKENVARDLPDVVAYFNSYGFTATYDAGVPPGAEPVIFEAAGLLAEQGDLDMRISASIIAQRPFHLAQAYEFMDELPPLYQGENFKVDTLKIHGGSVDGFSAPLLEPYSDRPDYSGPTIFPYDVRVEATTKAVQKGLNVHTHVIGDKAIREALDAFEVVRKAGYDQARLTTGHSMLIHPDDQPRYAALNVTMNTYAAKNAVVDATALSRLGPERLNYWMNQQSLVKQGARLAMSADAPTAPLDPWLQMEVAMLRKEPDHSEAFMPEEGLTLEQVIRAYTMGAAYQLGWDDIIGSIEVGKRADLVVASQNLFEIEKDQTHKTQALITLLGGEVVHEEKDGWEKPYEFIDFDGLHDD